MWYQKQRREYSVTVAPGLRKKFYCFPWQYKKLREGLRMFDWASPFMLEFLDKNCTETWTSAGYTYVRNPFTLPTAIRLPSQ